jgi:hypothetical protein
MKSKLHNDFYTLIQPVLEDAGCTFRILPEGQFLVHNGDTHFTIKQLPEPKGSTYERVLLESRFKDDRAKVLFEEEGALLITNRLSGIHPEFNVVCSNDGRIRIRYSCDIKKPVDLLPHIAYACSFFNEIEVDAKIAIVSAYELYRNKNNNKTK